MGTLYGFSPGCASTRRQHDEHEGPWEAHPGLAGNQWRPLSNRGRGGPSRPASTRRSRIGNQIFNVWSNAQNYRILEMRAHGTLKKVDIQVEHAQFDARDYRVSFDKIQRGLGFRPSQTIPQAARRIVRELVEGQIKNPYARVYYNHYFDATEES
jgi:hypothetical protein